MKKIKVLTIVLMMIIAIAIFIPSSKAASLTIAFSKSNVTVGETVNVTVNGSGITGKVSLSVSGNATLSENSVWVDNSSATIKAQINGEGSIKITATPIDVSDSTTAETLNIQPTAGTINATAVSSSSSTSSSEKNNNTQTTTSKKSNNANLSDLGIKPNDFKGFKPGTLNYNVIVPEDVEKIEIYAKLQDSKAQITGTGNKTLKEGENAFSIVVTAEDGTKKTYTINVTRESKNDEEKEEKDEKKEENENKEDENTQEIVEENNAQEKGEGLSELKIEGLDLNPSFKTDVYEYEVKYIGENTKLNIITKATNEDYVVDITGNEDLKEGENVITILVSDKDSKNVATYQITVNKSLVDEEAIVKEHIKKQEENRKKIIMAIAAAVIIAIIIVIIVRSKRNRDFEEYEALPFSTVDGNDEDTKVENLSHDNLKNEYLENYEENQKEIDFYQEDRPRKPRHKGKRFK